jgi:hypothetical protein
VQCLLFFHDNNSYKNASQQYVDTYIACLVRIAISSIQALRNLRNFRSRNLKKVNNELYHFVTVAGLILVLVGIKAQWDEAGGRICWQVTQEMWRSCCGESRYGVLGFGFHCKFLAYDCIFDPTYNRLRCPEFYLRWTRNVTFA